MDFPAPGRCRTAASMALFLLEQGSDLGMVESPGGARGPLGRPITLFGKTLDNRFAIHPMEGWDAEFDGRPSALTLRRWQRFGESGAALVCGGEAYAVREDGRANPRQLLLGDGNEPERGLASLLGALRDGRRSAGLDGNSCAIGLQLTHSGRWSEPHPGQKAPKIVHRHPLLDRRQGLGADFPLLHDAELEAIAERYVLAARLAARAGFDFVDVKACHGYLLHEILAAKTREGRYGGTFAKRISLLLRILAAIRSECPTLGLAVRLSAADVIPFERDPATGRGRPCAWPAGTPYLFGFGVDETDPTRIDLSETLLLLEHLDRAGVELVNVTLGSPYWCPHLQRPAAYPPSDGYQPPEDPMAGVALHLRTTRACKAYRPRLKIVGTGYSYLQDWLPHVAEAELARGGTDFVGLGRMVLSYPELPRDVLAGRPLERRKICRTFSECTTAPRNGFPSGCYPLDPVYRDRPEARTISALSKKARES